MSWLVLDCLCFYTEIRCAFEMYLNYLLTGKGLFIECIRVNVHLVILRKTFIKEALAVEK